MNGKTTNVGIVIVSHSPLVARGIADMVRQMVGDCLPLAWSGGNVHGELGTDAGGILKAIEAAWSDAGVAVFVDLGGAETNSEMAIEMLGFPRGARLHLQRAFGRGRRHRRRRGVGGRIAGQGRRHSRGTVP